MSICDAREDVVSFEIFLGCNDRDAMIPYAHCLDNWSSIEFGRSLVPRYPTGLEEPEMMIYVQGIATPKSNCNDA